MTKQKKPTIYDVAKLSGISITTISRVLNSPDKVNTDTRERVFLAIDQLGFVPKADARARKLQQYGRIGVITPFFTFPAFIQRLRGIDQILSPTHYEMIIYTVDSVEKLHNYLNNLPITGNLDGLILLSLAVSEKDVDRLIDKGLTAVLVEYPDDRLNSIEIDDVRGGYMAGEYLAKKGHRRMAFLGVLEAPKYSTKTIGGRFTGFSQALQEHHLELPEELIGPETLKLDDTTQLVRKLFQLKEPPTAIFSTSDVQALNVVKAVRKMGLRIPEDVAVMGFDDIDMAEYEELTTISQHLDESGRIAAEILLAHIHDSSRLPQHTKLPLTLIERATT